MKTEDVIYFYKDSCEKEPSFKRYKEIIEKQGSIQLTDNNEPVKAGNNTVRIYNPYLFFILTTEKLPVLNCETKEDTIIKGFDYLETFIQGYNEGMEYFIREFEVSPDTRYKNPQYAKDIYLNYFGGEGWEVIKRSHPGTFNHKSIKHFGFDSGIVSKVEELIKKSPALFENFDNHNKVVLKKELPEVKFTINGINIPTLMKELQHRNFFDNCYHDSILKWFQGVPFESPIPINFSANIFISLIADLKDQKFIKNSKKFCYDYICNSFLFKGKIVTKSYIEKVMKPNNENRVSSRDKSIPDIQLFKRPYST